MRWKLVPTGVAALAVILFAFAAAAQQQKPNILVIMADDIGYWNVSAYNRGQMGYRTPNIDRIANEGALLTDYSGQQSCTTGAPRSSPARARCGLTLGRGVRRSRWRNPVYGNCSSEQRIGGAKLILRMKAETAFRRADGCKGGPFDAVPGPRPSVLVGPLSPEHDKVRPMLALSPGQQSSG
jgi:hypothetical protein